MAEQKPIISIDHVSMRFNLAKEKHESLKEYFVALLHGEHAALMSSSRCDDVSALTCMPGDFYGLIGLNGSGKSTLLKVISGVYKPSGGQGHGATARIAPLIELGAGFDMDLTARENIYLNGTVLGYTPKYIDSKFNDIVEFSELEEFPGRSAEKLLLRHGGPPGFCRGNDDQTGHSDCGRNSVGRRLPFPGKVREAHGRAAFRWYDCDSGQPFHRPDRTHVQQGGLVGPWPPAPPRPHRRDHGGVP